MKGRVIVLQHGPSRAALVVDGRVEDLLMDDGDPTRPPQPGEIWAAQVTRLVQGAAFVKLGGDTVGYLRDARGLSGGAQLPVQITSVAEQGKATPVDRRILLKGRGVILTPGAPGINVSRQIKDPDERARLSDAFSDLPEATGLIVRSAAKGLALETLRSEYQTLADAYEELGPTRLSGAPLVAVESPETVALREWSSPPPDMIAMPEDLGARLDWDTAPSVFHHDPDLADAVRVGDGDPFDHFGVWEEIERLKSPRADLPSGGWMAVEATRAMVTVDVNTGDGFGGGDAMTANIEVARELPRQLRLRGLGGQVIVDFAPLKKMHRKKIEEELKRAFRKDPIETTLAGWTPLGNFELTRKRERRPLGEILR